ncbi:hypothetical protein BO94DRAFT_575316 [Aspergillus sclerotioniger CBS 115572]|uniref:DUF7924 domain-containing protein n=1 Tax=Aspergillus sclerotioniger CBS 115572 TaxID=1450535 RepID=A0A317WQN8_9EURO|nr:hypothetical protein BO94DRAFT_575316 [Aspergillus sclerotioniger CBS 115572]PWY87238.1 hypothetical protein BO94DRAFT_575316 [Aspergillus sclerotioniger CBS 115572]
MERKAGSECHPRDMKTSQSSSLPVVPLKQEYLLQLEAELNNSSSMTQPVGIGPQGLRTVSPPPSLTSVSTKQSSSSSPRNPSDSAYRARTLFRAGIHVDVTDPRQVQSHIDFTLEETPPATLATINNLASKLQRESMDLTAAQAGATEWTDLIYEILKEMKSTDVMVARNRGIDSNMKTPQVFDWRPDLKPEVRQPFISIPQKRQRDQMRDKTSEDSHVPAGPEAPAPSTQLADSPLLGRSQESTSASQLLLGPLSLKNPRPDISVGLSDQAFALALRSTHRDGADFFLNDLQETGLLISDPGVTPLGLRFPFLLIEAKSGATGGNLYQAQNQAAVGGASAINILNKVFLASETPSLNAVGSDVTLLTFSTAIEGPICVLWAHFWDVDEQNYCMANVGVWRTTHAYSAFDFVSKISRVLNWGTGKLKDTIVERLTSV